MYKKMRNLTFVFRVATGEEIISLAYKHGLPIIRMLHKADELVDEHNSSQERKFHYFSATHPEHSVNNVNTCFDMIFRTNVARYCKI